jgi:CBS domain containing-hemolysin-like protein
VHIKDLIEIDEAARDTPIDPSLIRALPTIDRDMPLRRALALMQNSGAHLGLVLDERGRTEGIVTLEDMLEELVGQIRDDSRKLQVR